MHAATYRAYSDNFTKQDIQAKVCKHKKELEYDAIKEIKYVNLHLISCISATREGG